MNILCTFHVAISWLCNSILAFINRNGDSATSWKIPHWIFTLSKLLLPAVNSILLVFSIKFMNSSDVLFILR